MEKGCRVLANWDYGFQVKRDGEWLRYEDLVLNTEKMKLYLGLSHYDVVIGDEDFCVAIWRKGCAKVFKNGKEIYSLSHLNDTNLSYARQSIKRVMDGKSFHFKRLIENRNAFTVTFWLNGSRYTCDYGYGWHKGKWLFEHQPYEPDEEVRVYEYMCHKGLSNPPRIVETFITNDETDARNWCLNAVNPSLIPFSEVCDYAQLEIWDGIVKIDEQKYYRENTELNQVKAV